jgi:hypothetical protein
MYCIIRFYSDGSTFVIREGVTLEEAQEHCRRENIYGEGWFDGYDTMENCR